MRIGLIAIGDAVDPAQTGTLAGRSLVRHQLDFVLAQGCEKVILHGHGASKDAIELRHAAEAAGAQFQVVRGVRDLPAAVRGDDQLLVLAQGLLPESAQAFEQLKEGYGVLVLPAEPGWSAGFERLDLAAAWGGAMVLPGRLVAGLDPLPEDAEPIAALLRIARQAGVPERPLAERELAEGRWQIVRTPEAARANEPAWLRRRLPPASPFRPTTWLARALVRRFGSLWLGQRRAALGFPIATLMLLAAGVTAAWFGLPALAFAVLLPAALAIEAGDAFGALGRSIFISESKRSRLFFALRLVWDVVLVAIGMLTVDGSPAHRLFAPLVSVGVLHVPPPPPDAGWRALAGDRGVLAALLALAAGVGVTEGGFMLLALLLIVLRIAAPAGERG
uniref:hypothetical protein n=1 Tax=Altererythrobacter segetis TaxID=1104773 RepID=UPI0014091ABA|nr:hypothetical protein [Altererythrobacter segetis]